MVSTDWYVFQGEQLNYTLIELWSIQIQDQRDWWIVITKFILEAPSIQYLEHITETLMTFGFTTDLSEEEISALYNQESDSEAISNTASLTFSTGEGDTDNTAFTITGNELKLNESADFETQNEYSIRVKGTDPGGLSIEKVFTISVTDVHENQSPVGITLNSNTIAENSPADTTIGTLSAIDPDEDETHTFNLTDTAQYPDNAAFTIEGNQLKAAVGFDFETRQLYTKFEVTDSSGLTHTQGLTIQVVDLLEDTPPVGEDINLPLGNGKYIELIWVEPGTFMMGSPDSEPNRSELETQHEVTLSKGFWLGKYEVTQEQWVQTTGSNPSFLNGDSYGLDKPVNNINWEDAASFSQLIQEAETAAGRVPDGYKYSFPTEAQWEYACRAGTTTATAFGDSLSSTQANFNGTVPYNGGQVGPKLKWQPVGSYAPNAWGFHDMHGNILELCWDWIEIIRVRPLSIPRAQHRGSQLSQKIRPTGSCVEDHGMTTEVRAALLLVQVGA